MDLLARREHGRADLRRKLIQRGFESADIEPVLDDLEADGLLSDYRYAESYARVAMERGQGPIKIARNLEGKGVARHIIDMALAELAPDWVAIATNVRERRFGKTVPGDFAGRVKQSRFLKSRGFTDGQIAALFGNETV